MNGKYTYNPSLVMEEGKDRMRFELGDTLLENERTRIFSDEEIQVMLDTSRTWKQAKFRLLEAVLMRFVYEVDTKTGPLELSLNQRFDKLKKMYDMLKKEIEAEATNPFGSIGGRMKPPYFREGMHDNIRVHSDNRGRHIYVP